jgi:hypothetical protein
MIERRMFLIELDHNEALDIADLTAKEWREIDRRAKQIIAAGQTKYKKIAFVAAFLNFISERQSMKYGFERNMN